MDEASAADVNADVRDLTAGAEEHEVARHQLAAADMLAVVIILRRRRARNIEAEMAVNILHEAGAVEACGRCAAVDIVIALERQGIGHQIVRQRGLLDRAVPRRGELIAAQEDHKRLQAAGGRLRQKLAVAALDRADVAQQARRRFRPLGKLLQVRKLTERIAVHARVLLRRIADGLHEVARDLEELLARQRIVRAEAAVTVALHDLELVGRVHVRIVRVREVRRAGRRIFRAHQAVIGQHGNGAHLRAGDGLAQVCIVEARRDDAELHDLRELRNGPRRDAAVTAVVIRVRIDRHIIIFAQPLADNVIRAAEHGDGRLPLRRALRLKGRAGAAHHAERDHILRRLECIVADGGCVRKLGKVGRLDALVLPEQRARHQVIGDLEEVLTAQRLIRAERLILVAVDDTLLKGEVDLHLLRVREIPGPTGAGCLHVHQVLIDLDGHFAHLAARDVGGKVGVQQAVRQQAERLHLRDLGLCPVADIRIGHGCRGKPCQQAQAQKRAEPANDALLFHADTSISSSRPTGQWSEP